MRVGVKAVVAQRAGRLLGAGEVPRVEPGGAIQIGDRNVERAAALHDRVGISGQRQPGASFKTTAAIQERLRALMDRPAVREVHADLVAREVIGEDSRFTFHGLRKNACCYLLERGLNDSEVGEILGMSPEMVRHYGKRARALMVARGAADRLRSGTVLAMKAG